VAAERLAGCPHYDDLGRLTQVVDTAVGGASGRTRNYSLDVDSTRTGLTQSASVGAPGRDLPGEQHRGQLLL